MSETPSPLGEAAVLEPTVDDRLVAEMRHRPADALEEHHVRGRPGVRTSLRLQSWVDESVSV